MRSKLVAGATILALSLAVPTYAHHSFSAFDRTRQVQVTGTVTQWQWSNPHTWLYVVVPVTGAGPANYSFEGYNPAELPRFGITRKKFKIGDKVTVTYFARKDHTNGGQFVGVVFAGAAPAKDAAP